MPITIDQFESGQLPDERSVPERVVGFLIKHDDRAFMRSEIAAGIEENPNAVGTALSRLKERKLVRHRGQYWAVTDDRERLRSAYDLHAATEHLDGRDGGIDPDEWDEHAPDEVHPSEQG